MKTKWWVILYLVSSTCAAQSVVSPIVVKLVAAGGETAAVTLKLE